MDHSQPEFYYSYIFTFGLALIIIELFIFLISKLQSKNEEILIEIEAAKSEFSEELIHKGEMLKLKYMAAFLLAKASMWAKAPYNFMLFSTWHKFSVGEIGILYLIDAISSLAAGPFLGIIADTYGRKITSIFYPLGTFINIALRLTASRPLAYGVQVMSGVFGGILNTAFESWLNYEITKLYGDEKHYITKFRKEMFSMIMFYDSLISISNYFGIAFSLGLSMLLAVSCICVIVFTWTENKPNADHQTHPLDSFKDGAVYLKDPSILSLGIIDSLYSCSIQIFIFVWTPVLQYTAQTTQINPGMIFIVMIIANLMQNKFLQLINTAASINYLYLNSMYIFVYTSFFVVIYFVEDFSVRLIFLALINGSGGFYNPVLAYLRSIILVEKYRALLMNLFRVPLNVFLITMLILAKYYNPLTICLMASFLLVLAFSSSVFLAIYRKMKLKDGKEF